MPTRRTVSELPTSDPARGVAFSPADPSEFCGAAISAGELTRSVAATQKPAKTTKSVRATPLRTALRSAPVSPSGANAARPPTIVCDPPHQAHFLELRPR